MAAPKDTAASLSRRCSSPAASCSILTYLWDGDQDHVVVANVLKHHFDPLVTASMCIGTCLGTYKDWKITKDDDNGEAAIADTYITLLPFSTDVNKLHGHAWCFYKEFVAFTRMKKLRIHDSDHELAGHPRQMY